MAQGLERKVTEQFFGEADADNLSEWNGFNNVGICAVALMCVLAHTERLSLPKTLLVMPIIMHEGTLNFLSNQKVKQKQIAALTALRADLFANFRQRFENSLVVTLNTIQLLVETGHIQFDQDIHALTPLELHQNFGSRALKIEKAAINVAALLESSDEELYLNLRVWL